MTRVIILSWILFIGCNSKKVRTNIDSSAKSDSSLINNQWYLSTSLSFTNPDVLSILKEYKDHIKNLSGHQNIVFILWVDPHYYSTSIYLSYAKRYKHVDKLPTKFFVLDNDPCFVYDGTEMIFKPDSNVNSKIQQIMYNYLINDLESDTISIFDPEIWLIQVMKDTISLEKGVESFFYKELKHDSTKLKVISPPIIK